MSILSTLRESAAPAAAVEIAAGHVAAATLEWRDARAAIAAHASEPLPDGALVPSLTAANVHDRPAVAGALGRVLERIGNPRRVGLVVADTVARVSLVRFAQVPPKTQDLDQLVRWQVKKSAPFPIEEAQVSYVPGLHAEDGQEFLVTLARRNVVEEYEQLCADAGAHAGLVDLSTINVINAVLAGSAPPAEADWLLVNIAAGYTSVAVLRGTHVIFFRNRTADTDGMLADLVHQTAMYYEDRLKGGGFTRVLLAGVTAADTPGGEFDHVRRGLAERLHTAVDTVDPRVAAMLTDRITAAPALLDTLTPLVGMLLRDRDKVAA